MRKPAATLIEQFHRNVCISDAASCWMWRGPKDQTGYGMMHVVRRKLSSDQIEMVRLLGQSGAYQRDIAGEYGVSQRTVNKIVNGLNGYGRNCL